MKIGKKCTLLIALLTALAMTLSFTACSGGGSESSDTVAPVITVENVPTTCAVGDTVTIPAARANDDVDGDISPKIKVTVTQM